MILQSLCYLVSFLCMAVSISRSDAAVNSTSSTSSCGPSMECANLANISYPFWGSASCAASPSYVLSNCSSSASSFAHWDSLSPALQAATTGGVRPAVITDLSFVDDSQGYASINLTWDTSLLTMDICASLFSPNNLSEYNIPASINLTGFANNTFDFLGTSFDNIYLFFNCTNTAAISQFINSHTSEDLWQQESDVCSSQKAICASRLSATSCLSLRPAKEVMLQHVMDTLACSHFSFGIVKSQLASALASGTPRFLNAGLVQVSWTSSECTQCISAGGSCIYKGKQSDCGCGKETIDPNTQLCQDTQCYGGALHCHRSLRIFAGVALTMIAVVLAILGFRYFGKIKKSFQDLFLKLARLAISVLKKVLRCLQQSTYRPNDSNILRDLEGLTERPMEYSYYSIASATKSFSNVIGEGGFGVVYKGTLPQSSQKAADQGRDIQIAVKVLEMRSKHMKNQFLNEVSTIGPLHHVNVVRLLGFCVQEDHEMLIYEYVANGSLDRWLFAGKDSEVDEARMLAWSQRYAIAVGVARGLCYLHEECRHRTVHCDIKPQNILLDDAMNPKIADFGLSRLMDRDESQVVTLARGTPGYMAPEFWRGGESRLSTKFDVYSYGMVLLELISGRRNFAYDAAMGSVCCFPVVAFEAAMQGNVAAILDARLGSTMLQQVSADEDVDEGQRNQIWTAAFVALWCIQDHPASRPSMSEVVQYLEGTIAVSRNPPQPSISATPSIAAPFCIQSQDQQDFTTVSVGR